jgi:hypothetical protein
VELVRKIKHWAVDVEARLRRREAIRAVKRTLSQTVAQLGKLEREFTLKGHSEAEEQARAFRYTTHDECPYCGRRKEQA